MAAANSNPLLKPYRASGPSTQVFQEILQEGLNRGLLPGVTTTARKWFRDSARKLVTVSDRAIMNSQGAQYRARVYPGHMYMYYYDPKLKAKLPYYDRFPLIFLIGPQDSKSFLGINLHYLPPVLRAKLMDALYTTLNNTLYNETTKLNITYGILKRVSRMREFKPCIKRYLNGHVRSRFMKIEPTMWDIALFLPTERFEKAAPSTVWNDSRKKISGR